MANYQQLKNALVDVIKQNGNNEITGEIMQTTLLSMINSLGANYQFAGVLTPSTSFIPTDENIFYIGSAGSYSNFGASTINVPNGCICIFTYNGSFASSILYVGGVVDISKLTNTSYASLSQALADVPLFLHIGGIEIMYQDSTSGNFVKYRLMKTSWSTTITDWQGIDTTPIAGSHNFVESGGIKEEITNAVYLPLEWQQGSPNTDGTSDGRTNRIMAVVNNLPAGRYYFNLPSGYYLACNFKKVLPSIGSETGWLATDYVDVPTEYNVYCYFILAKGDKTVPILPNEGYNLEVQPLYIKRIEKLESDTQDTKEYIDKVVGTYGLELTWQQGNVNNDGTADGTTNRIMARIDNLPTGRYKFVVPNGYQIAVNTKSVLPSAGISSGWLNTNEYEITQGNYVFFVARKQDNANIMPTNGLMYAVTSLVESRLTQLENEVNVLDGLKDIVGYDGYLSLSWVQGSPNTDGTSDGRTNRIMAAVTNLPAGTYRFELANGYRVAINQKTQLPAIGDESHWIYGGQWEITISNYVYFILAKDNVNANITPLEGVSALKVFKTPEYQYQGEGLSFGRGYKIKKYLTIPDWKNSQGGAIFKDMLVSCLAIDEVQAGQPNGYIHNIKNGNLISALEFGNTTLNNVEVERPHANEVCFGNEYYDSNSIMPLLYVSQVLQSKGVAGGVCVYDIAFSNNEYTPRLVQFIKPDTEDAELMAVWGNFTPNYIVDTDKGELYVLNYPNASWTSLNGNTYVCKFSLPKIADGEIITLTYDMLLDHYQLPNCYGLQQSFYYAGKLYISGGFGGSGNKIVRVIDLIKKMEVTQFDYGLYISDEPQFIGLYKNRFLNYGAGTSGVINEFIF